MTRIVAGSAGGRRLRTPTGSATRPTTDRVREALFSALESGFGSLEGCRFLDLYAGSGAVGLESLSRGAVHATLVERDRRTATLIAENARTLRLATAEVVARPVEVHLGTTPTRPYDVIFLDPPYALDLEALGVVVELATTDRWWSSAGWVVVERAARDRGFSWPERVQPVRERRYGETVLWYGRSHA